MMPRNQAGRVEDARDPVVEAAFRRLVHHTQAPQGFHARLMTRIVAESPTLRDRLVRWLSPPWQPTWAGELHVSGIPAFDRRWDAIVEGGSVRVEAGR